MPWCWTSLSFGKCTEMTNLRYFTRLFSVILHYTMVINTLRPRENGRHFADDIFKCIFTNENLWISIKFHWSLFPRVQLTIFQHRFKKWLGDDQATSHYMNQWWLDYRRVYASLGLNELKYTFSIHGIQISVTLFKIHRGIIWDSLFSNQLYIYKHHMIATVLRWIFRWWVFKSFSRHIVE